MYGPVHLVHRHCFVADDDPDDDDAATTGGLSAPHTQHASTVLVLCIVQSLHDQSDDDDDDAADAVDADDADDAIFAFFFRVDGARGLARFFFDTGLIITAAAASVSRGNR